MHAADPTDITIRPAAAGDLPVLGRLGALLVRQHHEFDPARFLAPSPQAPGLGAIAVLVAEREGRVLGYTYAGLEGTDYMALRGPAGALYDIVVDPAQRGEGIGRRLLEATVAALEALGAPRVVLSTAERNDVAQRLFARAGFRRTMIEMTRELHEQHPTPGSRTRGH